MNRSLQLDRRAFLKGMGGAALALPVLDAMGADKLLGKGDMLYLPPGSAKLIRAQGALITDQEIQSIVDFIARQAKPSYEMEIHKQLSKPVSTYSEESGCDEDEGEDR